MTFDHVYDLHILQEVNQKDKEQVDSRGRSLAPRSCPSRSTLRLVARQEAQAKSDAVLKRASEQDYKVLGGWAATARTRSQREEEATMAPDDMARLAARWRRRECGSDHRGEGKRGLGRRTQEGTANGVAVTYPH